MISGDEASLSIGTLLENMEGGAHLLGTLRERCRRKLWRWVSLSVGARFGEPGESVDWEF